MTEMIDALGYLKDEIMKGLSSGEIVNRLNALIGAAKEQAERENIEHTMSAEEFMGLDRLGLDAHNVGNMTINADRVEIYVSRIDNPASTPPGSADE